MLDGFRVNFSDHSGIGGSVFSDQLFFGPQRPGLVSFSKNVRLIDVIHKRADRLLTVGVYCTIKIIMLKLKA